MSFVITSYRVILSAYTIDAVFTGLLVLVFPSFRTQIGLLLLTSVTVGLTGFSFLVKRRESEKKHVQQIKKEQANIKKQLNRREQELETLKAQAPSLPLIQAIVHDLQKPFSNIQAALNLLERSLPLDHGNRPQLEFMKNLIEQSYLTTQNFLEDILEVGEQRKPDIKASSVILLLREAVEDISQNFRNQQVPIDTRWEHTHCIAVEESKIKKAFTNIIRNALQSMKGVGRIWLYTREDKRFLTLVIGNSGSYISPSLLASVFDPFFTFGKKNGKGLGLSITKQIVEKHGGRICVKSSTTENFVEFSLKLPNCQMQDTQLSHYFPKGIQDSLCFEEERLSVEINNYIIEKFSTKGVRKNLKKIQVGIIDPDESFYRKIQPQLVESKLENFVKISYFNKQESFLSESFLKFNFVFCEVDLRSPKRDGIELIKVLKKDLNFKGKCFLHTNDFNAFKIQQAAHLGLDGILPKYLSLEQLLCIIKVTQ